MSGVIVAAVAAAIAIVARPAAAVVDVKHSAAAMTITVASAQQAQWPQMLHASGAIAPWQEAVVGTQVDGLRLIDVAVEVGDAIKRGQVLARFDADVTRAEEMQLQATLAQAEAAAAQAEANRLRISRLREGNAISERDFLQGMTEAETTRAQVSIAKAQLISKRLELRYTNVVAPDDGVISSRSATIGAVAGKGEELFRFIVKGRLEWRGELTAEQLSQIQIGQRVSLGLPDGRQVEARVRRIAPTLDADSRLGIVYADIAIGGVARGGMYANGRIDLAERGAIVVPAASIVIRDGRSYVFKLKDASATSQVVAQVVTVGRRRGAAAEIVEGIVSGERVAVQGAGFLNDGDVVSIATPLGASLQPLTSRAPVAM